MNLYKIYGLIFESEIFLPSAYEVDYNTHSSDIAVKIIEGNYNNSYEQAVKCAKSYEKQENLLTNLTEIDTENETLLHVIGVGTFHIKDGSVIECMKIQEADIYQFEQWLLNMAVSICMIQRDEIILHGSAIEYDDRLLIISGESGSGKSTLTDRFLDDDNFKFVSDDSILLKYKDGFVCGNGAYPLRRLCDDVVKSRQSDTKNLIRIPDVDRVKYGLLMKDKYRHEQIRAQWLFIIEVSDSQNEVAVNEVTGSDKLSYIFKCLYKAEAYKSNGMTPEVMMQCLKLAENLNIYKVIRPKQGMTSDIQKSEICKILQLCTNRE